MAVAGDFNQLKAQINQEFQKTDMSATSAALVLQKNNFQNMTSDEKNDLIEDLSDRIRSVIQDRKSYLKNIFESKIYQLTEQVLKKKLSLPYKKITDTTSIYNAKNKTISIYRLSVEAPLKTKNVKITEDGFFTEHLAEIKESEVEKKGSFEMVFENEVDGQKMRSKVQFEPRLLRKTTPNRSPHYDNIISDGIYKGLVLIGTNMSDLAQPLSQLYLKYLYDFGFVLNNYKVVDTQDYLTEAFTGKEPLDYFTKEAHSGGDEKNFLRLSKKSTVYRVEKTHVEGYREIVEVVVPMTFELKESYLLTHDHVAVWMNQRENKKLGEVIYLNGSCWSTLKARSEISDINNPLLINIPSKTVAMTFRVSRTNGNFILLSSIRYMHNYKQMRDQLNTVPSYVNQTADYYLMPDQKEYETEVLRQIPQKFKFKTTTDVLIDGQWLPVEID